MRHLLIIAGLSGLITACAEATAATLDADDDLHCSGVVLAFKMTAEQQGAPTKVQGHLRSLDLWYAAKLKAAFPDRWNSVEAYEREALALGPLIESTEPTVMKEALVRCTQRATRDPRFDSFVRLGRASATLP